jgi:hypothetical protein
LNQKHIHVALGHKKYAFPSDPELSIPWKDELHIILSATSRGPRPSALIAERFPDFSLFTRFQGHGSVWMRRHKFPFKGVFLVRNPAKNGEFYYWCIIRVGIGGVEERTLVA